ncbi:MAG: 2-oxo acid dehydrogenase subunit E2 [Planctomycetaceae bacterium]
MTTQRNGRRFLVPRSRRLPWDLLWFHRSVPLCPHDRTLHVQSAAEARKLTATRISWSAVFMRATGLLSAEFPELRQIWYRWPWAHLYQHPHSVGVLTIQREMNDEPWLFWGRIPAPESLSLSDIQSRIDRYCTEPPDKVFSKMLQLVSLPFPLRRLIWWCNLNLSTAGRARRIGTFFLSTLAGQGTEIPLPPSVQTACLSWGPLSDQHTCRLTLAYDHRVFDGMLASRMLARLQELIDTTITTELRELQ